MEKKKIYSSESRQLTSSDVRVEQFIYRLKPAGKPTQSVNYTTATYTINNTFIFRKMLYFAALKKTDINVEVTQLDEKIFVRLLEMANWKAYKKDSKLL